MSIEVFFSQPKSTPIFQLKPIEGRVGELFGELKEMFKDDEGEFLDIPLFKEDVVTVSDKVV